MSRQPSPPRPRHRRPRHQPAQTAWTYTQLCRELDEGQILLRVHHSMSASQLIISPSPSTSGFFAPSPLFACVTPKTYPLVAGSVDPESPWMRELLVDHIRGSRRPYLGRNAAVVQPPDELSPWISCTASLDWAIWDIARCLARGGRWSLTLTIIRTDGPERWVIPFARPLLDHSQAMASGPLAYDRELQARRMAGSAREIMAYGRIFGSSIVASLMFTRDSLPFDLPPKFFRDPSLPPSAPGWMGRLCWNPQDDGYTRAKGAMAVRRDSQLPEPSIQQHTTAPVQPTPMATPRQGADRRPVAYAFGPTATGAIPRFTPPEIPAPHPLFGTPTVVGPLKPAGHGQIPPVRGEQYPAIPPEPRQPRQRPLRRIRPLSVTEQDEAMYRRGIELAAPQPTVAQQRAADPAISLTLAIHAREFVPRAQRADTATQQRQDFGPPGANRLTGPFRRGGAS